MNDTIQEERKVNGETPIPEDLVAEIKRRATDEALRGLKDLWKKEITKVYEDFDPTPYRNFRDAVRGLGEHLLSKTLNDSQQAPQQAVNNTVQQAQTQPAVNIEKELAKMRAEMEETLRKERQQLKKESLYDSLVNFAIGKGLNTKYADLFASVVRKQYVVDFDENGDAVLRDPATNELVLEKGKNPSQEFLIEPIIKNYSELFVSPKGGSGAAFVPDKKPQQNTQTVFTERDTVALIDSALKLQE